MLYSTLATDILGEFPNCPVFVVERAVREAAIEFFERSLAYSVTQDAASLPSNVETFDLELPATTRLVSYGVIRYDSRELSGLHRDDIDRSNRNWTAIQGEPMHYVYNDEASFRLYPFPDRASSKKLYVRFYVTPTRDSVDIPDILGERYYDHILYGARHRLARMPGTTWTNPGMAAGYLQVFEQKVKNAKADAFFEFGRTNRRVKLVRL